ncbi:MAG: sigma-54-dependent transcriptional regulator [Syntrophobacteraceae bacterium]
MKYCIFVIDDEPSARNGITLSLSADYDVHGFVSAERAIEAMRSLSPDLALLDVGLPEMNGVEALRVMKALQPDLIVIMITAYEDARTVISAMKNGAYDYVLKPFEMEELEITIRNALEAGRLRKEVRTFREREVRENTPCLIAESDAIRDVMGVVEKVARSPDTPVLICGETGTGKELLASAIHYRSPSANGPFIILNCAALPKELTESELFGYERGAFTGADASGKKGLVEEAEGGALFLDEVGDLSPEAQAKLLRFLENGEFFRVGGLKKRSVRTRVISATNKDLEELMERDVFRRDLYYRLAVVRLDVPSLNERRDDILPIAMHFLEEFGKKFGKPFKGIVPEAQQALRERQWKGNVRELKNVIERGVLLGDGAELTLADMGLERRFKKDSASPAPGVSVASIPPAGIDLGVVLKSVENHYIEEALRISMGNESKAAQLLHLNYYTFRNRHRKLR